MARSQAVGDVVNADLVWSESMVVAGGVPKTNGVRHQPFKAVRDVVMTGTFELQRTITKGALVIAGRVRDEGIGATSVLPTWEMAAVPTPPTVSGTRAPSASTSAS